MSAKIHAAALLGALASTVSAHGHVSGIVAGDTYYQGYDPSFQYSASPPAVAGWSCPECLDNGFVAPSSYGDNSKIACHKDATVGQAQVEVAAGSTVELQWTTWPDSHKGPVIDYLAPVDGTFTDATYDSLSFVKIDEAGYTDSTWASDSLISNNNSWTTTIPSSLAAGSYVLRHEIIALHSAGQADGAQSYPQCINLKVTSSGSTSISGGETADKFYTANDPGILVNIYSDFTSYEIPGPALWSGADSGSSETAVATSAAASSTAAASSVAASSSAAATTSVIASSSVAAVASSSVAAVAVSTSVSQAQAVASSTPAGYSVAATSTIAAEATQAPTATSDIAATIVSQIATAIPSGLLTSVLPSAIPTQSANTTGPLPEQPLPEGFTLKDLLDWVAYIIRNFGKKAHRGNAHARQHPRAFN
ncbi:lytic polysaccharide monooxygenase [Lophiostoma macrostomum CBS 122681]|uniref:AA9 family lytic polysaccharide monooxygenase n=1 Tax=Lophiostoma macrostomum CBS 122681 TaxID=1314788 RepID=A0A6A6TNP9_9PLEO|nr:lytic polysaccharide monooxygenase [Lophiostoma macrostomum CBS 122681]